MIDIKQRYKFLSKYHSAMTHYYHFTQQESGMVIKIANLRFSQFLVSVNT